MVDKINPLDSCPHIITPSIYLTPSDDEIKSRDCSIELLGSSPSPPMHKSKRMSPTQESCPDNRNDKLKIQHDMKIAYFFFNENFDSDLNSMFQSLAYFFHLLKRLRRS